MKAEKGIMEISEYIRQGQGVDLTASDGEVKESCKAIVDEARGDRLSVVLDDTCCLNIKNGDAVTVASESGSMVIYLDARAIGNRKDNSLNMRVTGRKAWKGSGGDFRVHASLPFDYVKVPNEEYERHKGAYGAVLEDEFLSDPWQRRKNSIDREDLDPAVYNCLADIEQKLNLIIKHLSSQGKGQAVIPAEEEIEISSTGIMFDSDKSFTVGDLLKIRMILPTYPISFLTFFSEVESSVQIGADRYATHMIYLGLNTEVRDKITAYLFKKQREALRMRNAE